MSDILVIDASVALKWVVEEERSDRAAALLIDFDDGEVELVAPEHLVGEVGNGLRKRVTQQVLSVADARAALVGIRDLELELIADPARWYASLSAALDWQLTTYDAHYVLLAQAIGGELVTADARIVAAARVHRLPVRPL
ncbi:MAG: type II toxin-antitoxin system VapC family toxin [Sporichthyaceae bacterium]